MKSHEDDKKAPLLHYIWVGPPNEPGSTGIPGHDIAGPMEMTKVNQTNPIIFWCLDKYVENYKEIFNQYSNIEVQSIELYVEALIEKEKEKIIKDLMFISLSFFLKEIIATNLNEEKNRGSVRDKVTVKVAFSLLLLHHFGGYTLDTNIFPLKENEVISLPQQAAFTIPAFNTYPPRIEFWMMYSPSANNEVARNILEQFYLNWKDSEEYLEKNGLTKDYYALMPVLIGLPLSDEVKKGRIKLLIIPEIKINYVEIEQLGLIKYYSNTHKFNARNKYDPALFGSKGKNKVLSNIFISAQVDNPTWLRSLIKHGVNLDEQIKKDRPPYYYKGQTALHIAIEDKQPANVKILLEAGANPDLIAIYPGNQAVTARSLMQGNPIYETMLAERDAKNPNKPLAPLPTKNSK